jgi:hypothetical protein
MSDAASVLGTDAVDLLLTLLETPEAQLSGAALHDFYPDAGVALIHAGALKDDGHEPVITGIADHDDVPVRVTWRPEFGGYACFSPSAGWVKVESERLRLYRIDFAWLLALSPSSCGSRGPSSRNACSRMPSGSSERPGLAIAST